ncbi:MAG: hypothetical protein ACAI25_02270, partial [Planctomycetota bacterium]
MTTKAATVEAELRSFALAYSETRAEPSRALPFVKPANGGRSVCGWVSAHFDVDEEPPLELLREWIDESYRAVAP